jgi:hypothetical protein
VNEQQEALRRARLGRLRNRLQADRNDNTSIRSFADRAFGSSLLPQQGVSYKTSLSEEEYRRSGAAASALLTGFTAPPLALGASALAGNLLVDKNFATEETARELRRNFPQLDSSLFSEDGARLRERTDLSYIFGGRGAIAEKISYDSNLIGIGLPLGSQSKEGVNNLDRPNWERTGRNIGKNIPGRMIVGASPVPQPGPDLGGFGRGWQGPGPESSVAYTVVPNVNSSRFSQKLAPPLLDQVYTKDASMYLDADPEDWGRGTIEHDFPYRFHDRSEKVKPVPRNRMADMKSADRVELLERLIPKQTTTGNQSGYLWGTLTERPRYEYGSGQYHNNNPEVIVSEVRTPAELETKYLYTGDSRNPKVSYKANPGNMAMGPSWGVSGQPLSQGSSLAGRPKRMTAGDISFRGDLIERRGGLSLADAQAVQSQLQIRPTLVTKSLPPAQALEKAIDSIAQKEGLDSHAAVVERYARRLPSLGRTTAPRGNPALGIESEFPLDTTVAVPQRFRQAFEVPEALSAAGYEPSRTGLASANRDASAAAARRLSRTKYVSGALPAAGALLSLADPQAAELAGAAVSEKDPEIQRALAVDAVRVYGQNATVGAVTGGVASAVLPQLSRMGLGAAVAPLTAGLAVTGPAIGGAAAVQSVDAYLMGATGRGLASHTRSAQDTAAGMTSSMQAASPRRTYTEGWITVPGKGRRWRDAQGNFSMQQPGTIRTAPAQTARQAVPQLFPTPRAVPANTPSGVAQVTRTQQQNPVIREARNRAALFRQRFNPAQGEFGLTELLMGR